MTSRQRNHTACIVSIIRSNVWFSWSCSMPPAPCSLLFRLLLLLEQKSEKMYRTHTCGELRIENKGIQVTLSGWIQASRDLGGMTFIDLRDRYGITQLVFNMDTDPTLCQQARKMGREFVIQISGLVRERTSKNPNRQTGDI